MSQANEDRFILSFTHDSSRIDVYESGSVHNPEWNTFLEHTQYGQYEQTDYWSRLKKEDSWTPLQLIYRREGTIVGGFLILYKKLVFNLNIGYITRGPVFDDERLITHESLLTCLKKCCDNYRIIFILIQQPDDSYILPDIESSPYLLKNNSIGLVKANIQIDLSQSIDDIISKFKRDKVKNIRKASRLNSILWEGKRENLAQFFSLMLSSCDRQHVSPQPDNLDYIVKMWDLFSERDMIRLFFMDVDGETVSALLLIRFNQKAYKWKFGWSGRHPHSGINDYFYFKIIEWAKKSGFHHLVDMGVDPLAQTDRVHTGGASLRKVRFGGDIKMLPDSYVFVSNRLTYYLLRFYELYRKIRLKKKKYFTKHV